ncbi:MAG: FAD-dependent oxidoreductase [Anaerolineales bacterium]
MKQTVFPAPATFHEPARETPVLASVDVLVVGGGPAGIAAALAAAREGANTLLIERYGYLGGMITGAYVVYILGVGDGLRPVARGITEEIREHLARYGGVQPMHAGSDEEFDEFAPSGDYVVDAELFKWQAAEMLTEAGVRLRLHTVACDPLLVDQRVVGAAIESKSGRQAILAQVVIDCSADADLAYRAGVPCVNETHEVTLGMSLEGVDRERVEVFRAAHPQAYDAAVSEARQLNGGVMPGSSRRLREIDIADAEALTQAEISLRHDAFVALQVLSAQVPGYENARIATTYPQLGVRQGRRICGEYTITDQDLRESRRFADGIARLGVYFPDWGPTYRLHGLAYDLPYRCLVPQDIDGLLVAGRCLSADYVACNTLRLIVPCLCSGQAAGVAAAIAVELGCAPRAVPADTLHQALSRQNVNLG